MLGEVLYNAPNVPKDANKKNLVIGNFAIKVFLVWFFLFKDRFINNISHLEHINYTHKILFLVWVVSVLI